MNHYLWAGERDFCGTNPAVGGTPFRVLIAGGGTGEKTLQLARQLVEMRSFAHIVHLDISRSSLRRAARRIRSLGFVPGDKRRAGNFADIATERDGTDDDGEPPDFLVRLGVRVNFVLGSIVDLHRLADLGHGPFDYVDCLGVLHHLPDPAQGLEALARVLAPGGGMAVMLYGELGRTGVYHAQQMLRLLTRGERGAAETAATSSDIARQSPNPRPPASPDEAVDTAERLLDALPATNWLRIDPWRWTQLRSSTSRARDPERSHLVDLLLPRADVAFTVPDVYALVEKAGASLERAGVEPTSVEPTSVEPTSVEPTSVEPTSVEPTKKAAALRIVTFLQPAVYAPETYLRDPALLARLPNARSGREAFAELLAGNVYHHFFYVARADAPGEVPWRSRPAADAAFWASVVPVPVRVDPVELAEDLDAGFGAGPGEERGVRGEVGARGKSEGSTSPTQSFLPWRHRNLDVQLPLPARAAEMLRSIDGATSVRGIFDAAESPWAGGFDEFLIAFKTLLAAMRGINKMVLARVGVPAKLRRLGQEARAALGPGAPGVPWQTPARCPRAGGAAAASSANHEAPRRGGTLGGWNAVR
jgi:SAM-dependent methyltransferase